MAHLTNPLKTRQPMMNIGWAQRSRYAVYALALALGNVFGAPAFAQDGDAENGELIFQQCRTCHQIGPTAANGFGPNLTGVTTRKIGTADGYTYSGGVQAVAKDALEWTPDRLFEWLAGPTAFVQGRTGNTSLQSKMTFSLADPQMRRDVIAYLATFATAEVETPVTEKAQVMSHGDTPFDPASATPAENGAEGEAIAGLERVRQTLVAPPFLPDHSQVASGPPKIVEVALTTTEKRIEIDNAGTSVVALTFNGSVPGPMIVVHEGDYVELTLTNPATNIMEHNIDLHAATGALGGAGLTSVLPGEQAVLRFKADRPGVFMYHCAPEGTMTPYHVTHGMNGAILVLPRQGLHDGRGNLLHYDRAYFIGEQDFYIPRDETGAYRSYTLPGEDIGDWLEIAPALAPTHVVFNGRVGALTGQGALRADVGETVLFLHSQANRDTRPHLIGGHGDYVWEEGSFNAPPLRDLETWFIRGGSAGAALYTFRQPGVYAYLNHNLIEAVELGAAAHVVVSGDWDDDLMKQVYHGPIR